MSAKTANFFEELKQRLNQVEAEQHRQSSELTQLSDLEQEVMRLENRLQQIETGTNELSHSHSVDFNQMRDLKEINRLERELKSIKISPAKEKTLSSDDRYFDEIEKLRMELGEVAQKSSPKPIAKPKPTPVAESAESAVNSNRFIICWVNGNTILEWSESAKSWQKRGQGQAYSTPEQARTALTRIKQQWPDYVLKVVKR